MSRRVTPSADRLAPCPSRLVPLTRARPLQIRRPPAYATRRLAGYWCNQAGLSPAFRPGVARMMEADAASVAARRATGGPLAYLLRAWGFPHARPSK